MVDACGRAARRARPGRRGVVNKPASDPARRRAAPSSDRVGSDRVE